jgi:hypothetical protein
VPDDSDYIASEAERLLGLLADPDRLRVVSALALGASSPGEVRTMTGLDVRTVERALARLIAGELVVREENGVTRLVTEQILTIAREAGRRRDVDEELDASETEAVVLKRFIRKGRLTQIPIHRSKRRVLLDYLAQRFEPGRFYSEQEVNDVLATFHPDVASLRRFLVDEDFMERERGRYWRAGGTFDI